MILNQRKLNLAENKITNLKILLECKHVAFFFYKDEKTKVDNFIETKYSLKHYSFFKNLFYVNSYILNYDS